jgi:hypothetical protein
MSENYNQTAVRSESSIDEGLRTYMNGIYARMSAGVLVTAVIAFAVGTTPALFKMLMGGPQAYLFIFAPLVVQIFGFRPDRMSASKLQGVFFLLSALYGVCFSSIAFMATAQPGFIIEVARAFFITVAMFAGLSIYGYTTKKNLSGMGQFIFMGVLGVLVMSIINMFVQSSGFSIIISLGAIVVFSGLTVWETQQLKQMYLQMRGSASLPRLAWAGAYTLYLSFIALFMHILNLLSHSR